MDRAGKHFADLKIGKKSFRLTYDLDALARAEELTGEDLIFGVNWTALGVKKLVPMLYAALLCEHPTITLAEVKRMVIPRNSMPITASLYEAWWENQAEPDETEEGETPENPLDPKA